jgi:hypothetical protein
LKFWDRRFWKTIVVYIESAHLLNFLTASLFVICIHWVFDLIFKLFQISMGFEIFYVEWWYNAAHWIIFLIPINKFLFSCYIDNFLCKILKFEMIIEDHWLEITFESCSSEFCDDCSLTVYKTCVIYWHFIEIFNIIILLILIIFFNIII